MASRGVEHEPISRVGASGGKIQLQLLCHSCNKVHVSTGGEIWAEVHTQTGKTIWFLYNSQAALWHVGYREPADQIQNDSRKSPKNNNNDNKNNS